MAPYIFIHVLAYGGKVYSQTAAAMVIAALHLERRGIKFKIYWSDITGIATARNMGAAMMLSDPECTHLCQIDRDMAFEPSTIPRMLDADKDVIGCIARRRTASQAYNFSGPLEPQNQPIFRVKSIGTGVWLCKREVLERLASSGQVRRAPAAGGNPETYGFFDTLYLKTGVEMQDDNAFCIRWWELCGGHVHALSDETIIHVGPTMLRTNFLKEQRPT